MTTPPPPPNQPQQFSPRISTVAPRTPPPPASLLKRVVLWSLGLVVGSFVFLVIVGLIVGVDPDPILSVEDADVYGIAEGPQIDTWVVVVEPGTTTTALGQVTETLLDLPEAAGRDVVIEYFNSTDELEGYIDFVQALAASQGEGEQGEGKQRERAIDAVFEAVLTFDLDVLYGNAVGRVNQAGDEPDYHLCVGELAVCRPDTAVATFSR